MKIIYQSSDGKNFKTEKECISYEKNTAIVYVLERRTERGNDISSYSVHSTNKDASNIINSMVAGNTPERKIQLIKDFKITEHRVELVPIMEKK